MYIHECNEELSTAQHSTQHGTARHSTNAHATSERHNCVPPIPNCAMHGGVGLRAVFTHQHEHQHSQIWILLSRGWQSSRPCFCSMPSIQHLAETQKRRNDSETIQKRFGRNGLRRDKQKQTSQRIVAIVVTGDGNNDC